MRIDQSGSGGGHKRRWVRLLWLLAFLVALALAAAAGVAVAAHLTGAPAIAPTGPAIDLKAGRT